jgi:hypothetical protein
MLTPFYNLVIEVTTVQKPTFGASETTVTKNYGVREKLGVYATASTSLQWRSTEGKVIALGAREYELDLPLWKPSRQSL